MTVPPSAGGVNGACAPPPHIPPAADNARHFPATVAEVDALPPEQAEALYYERDRTERALVERNEGEYGEWARLVKEAGGVMAMPVEVLHALERHVRGAAAFATTVGQTPPGVAAVDDTQTAAAAADDTRRFEALAKAVLAAGPRPKTATPVPPPPPVQTPIRPVPTPTPTPTPMPTLWDVNIPAYSYSDPEEVGKVRQLTAGKLSGMRQSVQGFARLGSPDPVAEAVRAIAPYYSLARYLCARLVARRDDLAAAYLPAAVPEYQFRRAVIDKALPDLLPAELVEAATQAAQAPAAPAAAPAPAPAKPVSSTPTPTARTAKAAGKPLTRLKGQIIPANEIDAWAISAEHAKRVLDRADADLAKVKAETTDATLKQEHSHRYWAGELVGFAAPGIAQILAERRQDLAEGIKSKAPPHLSEKVKARKAELWADYLTRKAESQQRKAKKVANKKARTKNGKSIAPSHQKILQFNDFMDGIVRHELSPAAVTVWCFLFRHAKGGLEETADRAMANEKADREAGKVTGVPLSKKTVIAARTELQEKGFLERISDGVKDTSYSVYRIHHVPAVTTTAVASS